MGRALWGGAAGTAEMTNVSNVRGNATIRSRFMPGNLRPRHLALEIYVLSVTHRHPSSLALPPHVSPAGHPPTRGASTGSACLFPAGICERPTSKHLRSQISLLLRHPQKQGRLLVGTGRLRRKGQLGGGVGALTQEDLRKRASGVFRKSH